ncbi:hypothetical protein [Sphingomonas sp.]|jgi:hypothetical protein|uniref:hypothetical protein n=1 Tax=Sphingomonas sp. TaxID=28214 RepID=UPI002D808058|nr:hypothetical protein [Sphingomonas sp.]HEU0043058.1 hypothetical protein [Sphingomonas sp.]
MKAFAAAALLLAGPALADPLQDQVLAGMRRVDTSDVAFTASTRIQQSGKPAKEVVTRHDPRAPAGRRWSVVSVDGKPATPKEAAQIVKAANGAPPPSYARLARWFGSPATRVAQAPGSVTYRFARLPAGIAKLGNRDMSADTMAEATVDTSGRVPFVERIRFSSTKGFRMMLVAKVDRYVATSTYAPLPDGRIFPAATQVEMVGSMMGKGGTLTTATRYAQ